MYELGVEPDKMIFVLNKADLVSAEDVLSKTKYLKLNENKKWIPISAVTGENLSQLKELIGKIFDNKIQVSQKKSLKAELDGIYGI